MPPKKSLHGSAKSSLTRKGKKVGASNDEVPMELIEEENIANEEVVTEEDTELQMQIMPYVVRSEAIESQDINDETSMSVSMGEDILSRTRVFSCHDCPSIPLCRFIPYAKVRGLRSEISGLKTGFGKEGYVPEKGVFIVSLCTYLGETKLVDEAIVSGWDPLWVEVNKEFEEELSINPVLQTMSNHMFYVWEGNHRTVAWMEAIKERFLHRKEKHVRVLSTIIDPRKVSEISLLSCLQRMNFLNTHALVATSLRDELVNTSNICMSNSDDYLKELSQEDVILIEQIRKKHTKGEEPWFPLTRRYLAKLVYNIQMHSELQKELDPLRGTLPPFELKQVENKKHGDILCKYSDRIGKILNIIDPKLGEEWWDKVLALKWSMDSFATLEKLNLLAICEHIPDSTRVFWLSLMEATKVTKAVYALPRGDRDFRSWLTREAILERVKVKAEDIMKDFIDHPEDLVLPEGLSLHTYYEEIRMDKRKSLFPLMVRLETREKDVDIAKMRKYDLIQMAAQRVVYRFFIFLRDGGHLLAVPLGCKQWIPPANDLATMYTPDMLTLSRWEIENCPWWIDMVKGQVIESEKEKYKEIYHELPKESLHTSPDMQGPKKRINRGSTSEAPHKSLDDNPDMEVIDSHGLSMDGNMVKRVNTFVFIEKHAQDFFISAGEQKCMAVVGDYVAIGKDFASGLKNPSYTKIHEHFKGKCPKNREYVRIRKAVSWAADLVFLDLPFGGVLYGPNPHPSWDHLVEENVRYGISMAAASLADQGWMIIMCSSAGPSVGWIERYARVSGLEIWHRVVVLHDSPYGYLKIANSKSECTASVLFIVRRQMCEPLLYLEASAPFFQALQFSPLDTVVYHHLPIANRAIDDHGREWRGSLQRSQTFIACYLELLCRHGGLVLEIGCGTAPLLLACLQSGRMCVSLDSDEAIISSCVLPLLVTKQSQRSDIASSSHDGDDAIDIMAGVAPYDD